MTKIGLSDADRKGSVKVLSALLADEYVLYTKTRNYHWNVTGPHFNDLHKFFEVQFAELILIVDDVAERIRSLGDLTPASLGEFVKATRLQEHPGDFPDAAGMIVNLVADHESLIRHLRTDLAACADKFHDMGTSDFLTGLMEQHEKMAWMLRSIGA